MTGSILEGYRLLVPPKWMGTEGWEWTTVLALARARGGCVSASGRQIEGPPYRVQKVWRCHQPNAGHCINKYYYCRQNWYKKLLAARLISQVSRKETKYIIALLSMSDAMLLSRAHMFNPLFLCLVIASEQNRGGRPWHVQKGLWLPSVPQ